MGNTGTEERTTEMLLDAYTANYLALVAESIEAGCVLAQMSNVCPECGETQGVVNNLNHVVMSTVPPTSVNHGDSSNVCVVIGCQGYWVINPNEVGVPAAWQPIEAMNADAAADGYARGDHLPDVIQN